MKKLVALFLIMLPAIVFAQTGMPAARFSLSTDTLLTKGQLLEGTHLRVIGLGSAEQNRSAQITQFFMIVRSGNEIVTLEGVDALTAQMIDKVRQLQPGDYVRMETIRYKIGSRQYRLPDVRFTLLAP